MYQHCVAQFSILPWGLEFQFSTGIRELARPSSKSFGQRWVPSTGSKFLVRIGRLLRSFPTLNRTVWSSENVITEVPMADSMQIVVDLMRSSLQLFSHGASANLVVSQSMNSCFPNSKYCPNFKNGQSLSTRFLQQQVGFQHLISFFWNIHVMTKTCVKPSYNFQHQILHLNQYK